MQIAVCEDLERDAARKIRVQDEECAIIFITTSENHAVQGFALRAAHYLIKPIDYTDFCDAMSRCKKQIDQFSRYIEVMENREQVHVRIRDLCQGVQKLLYPSYAGTRYQGLSIH